MEEIKNNVYVSNSGLEYIVEKFEYKIKTEYYYTVKFLKTGTAKIAEKRNIKKGRIADEFDKNIYNVACKGFSSSKYPILNKIAFKRWYSMIERCYNKKSIGYKSYGNKGIEVCNRWLCFDNFLEDLTSIDGFVYEKYVTGEIELDKDYKKEGNKIYSKNTCVFLSEKENKRLQPTKQKRFMGINKNGDVFYGTNQKKFAQEHGLTARTIGKVLNNDLKTHKGWKFSYVESNDYPKAPR